MKNLSFIKKIILVLNYIAALALLIGFVSPYLPAGFLSFLQFTSLIFPFLVLLNILFVLYWLLQFKKYVFISLLTLMLNYYHIQAIYQWSGKHTIEPKGFTLMSYNVRLFNAYQWIKTKGIPVDISNYIKDQHPAILLLQEYRQDAHTDFSQYKYKHIVLKGKKRKAGLAIFSNYKIVNQGDLNFKDTYNNAIWADVLVGKDTIRIYNVHLQSYKIVNPNDLVDQDSEKVRIKLQNVFNTQQRQARKVQANIENSKYATIVGGDFNNTAFSAPYRILKSGKQDAFVTAGNGFGTTWQFKYIPLRIDFILADDKYFNIENFETLNHIKFSDHFPIKTSIRIRER